MLTTLGQYSSSSSSSGGDALVAGTAIFIVLVALVVMLAIAIAICFALYTLQKRVPVEHQKIEPKMIWLLLIPLFNLFWNFIVFQRIPESYKSHFDAQGDASVGDCGKSIGLWYAICAACSIVPCVNYITGPASLVLFIIFLVKLFGLRGKIPEAALEG